MLIFSSYILIFSSFSTIVEGRIRGSKLKRAIKNSDIHLQQFRSLDSDVVTGTEEAQENLDLTTSLTSLTSKSKKSYDVVRCSKSLDITQDIDPECARQPAPR